MRTRLILGGPGCGKTTRLLEIMENYLAQGIAPQDIAFVSFTRAAVREAKQRAMERFNLQPRELPYFRTLHSLAFHLMELDSKELVNSDDHAKIGRALGMEFNEYSAKTNVSQNGERVLFPWMLARARGITLREQFNMGGHNLPWPLVQHTAATVEQYKQDMGLYDYQDLIEQCRIPVPVHVAIVDECQDLTTTQWNMVEACFAQVPNLYYAGDDDQAIYQWTGADVERFLNLQAHKEVLPKSHRLPEAVWRYAAQQVQRITNRYTKNWTYHKPGGTVTFQPGLNAVDFSAEGSWLILARNHYVLESAGKLLRSLGIVYNDSVDRQHVLAIQGWEKHKRNVPPTEEQAAAMRALLPKHWPSPDTPWMEALTGIAGSTRAYYRAIKQRGGRVTAEPRIRLSTIHQIKGAEADNVVLLTDMAARTYKEYMAMPQAEHRVWYVAITRAREALHIVQPSSANAYRIISEKFLQGVYA